MSCSQEYAMLRDLIRRRRSIRKFKPDEPPRELIEDIIDTCIWAPTDLNRQNWEVVALHGPKRKELAKIIARAAVPVAPRMTNFNVKVQKIVLDFFGDVGGAPWVVLVYAPWFRVGVSPDDCQDTIHVKTVDRTNAFESASALTQNLLLLAEAAGLGACWMTGPKYVADEINEFMGIKDRELVAVIPIGYTEVIPPTPPRKQDRIKWVTEDRNDLATEQPEE